MTPPAYLLNVWHVDDAPPPPKLIVSSLDLPLVFRREEALALAVLLFID